jgi:outer membrane receptor for ferrienterochelin and colicin
MWGRHRRNPTTSYLAIRKSGIRSDQHTTLIETAQSLSQLKEIVVTAEKRAQNLEKAPATVSVVTGNQLVTRGVQDISEATVDYPSVKFGQISGTTRLSYSRRAASARRGKCRWFSEPTSCLPR